MFVVLVVVGICDIGGHDRGLGLFVVLVVVLVLLVIKLSGGGGGCGGSIVQMDSLDSTKIIPVNFSG